ncbi:MAG: 16S rRNA (adenine(1518)-N(6)/adenine(1519)-N(6))-dimethyltransferase RsmA [Clostridia bacterium]|nr:16S rRNA (adenine(1518)-N(6)/adenine(1519)-N(6))-dimethyltransferase RsmA [Clostridia bacterium]
MSDKIYTKSAIGQMKNKYGFKFTKSLGQNFLTDGNVIEEIVEASGATKDDLVIEIGPGMGVLTHLAAERAGHVVAIEIDQSLIPILEENLKDLDNVTIINEDVLKLDINEIIDRYDCKSVKIIGNLPYYITTPIIMKLLEENVKADSITIMLQKEVAERINAEPGTKAYGAISVAVKYYATVDYIIDVPKEVFIPQPKVDSSVIRLNILQDRSVKVNNEDLYFKVVKAGFGMRRKTLSNSLTLLGIDKSQINDALEKAGINPTRRAETLSLEEFAKLTEVLDGIN